MKFCYLELFKKIAFASLYRPGHSDKPFAAPKPYTRPLTGLRYPLKNSSDTLLCRQHETLTDTILQKWGRLLMVFGVCV